MKSGSTCKPLRQVAAKLLIVATVAILFLGCGLPNGDYSPAVSEGDDCRVGDPKVCGVTAAGLAAVLACRAPASGAVRSAGTGQLGVDHQCTSYCSYGVMGAACQQAGLAPQSYRSGTRVKTPALSPTSK